MDINVINFYILFIFSLTEYSLASNSYLKGPPTLLTDRDTLKKTGTEGKDIKLSCPAAGNPQPIIEWSKNDITIPDNGWERFRLAKNSLKIKELTAEDQGTYVCKAVNGFGSVQFTFYLGILASIGNVLSSPAGNQLRMDQVFPVSGSTLRKLTGQAVRFKCLAVGDPEPEITWLKNGQVLEPPDIINDGEVYASVQPATVMQHSLPLTQLTPSDSGNYSCIASNRHGVVSANWTLNVVGNVPLEGPEVFPLEMSNVTSFSGEEATLSCRGSWDSDITPKVMWLRQINQNAFQTHPRNQTFSYKGKHYQVLQPTELILLENGLFMTKLVLQNVHLEDTGVYVCTVSNRYGINVRQANLTVLESQSENNPILLLSFIAMAVVVIIVIIVSISVCRRKSKPSLPGPTERALIPPAIGPSHAKLQPAPSSHQPRYVIHRARASGAESGGVLQYPTNLVHLATKLPSNGGDSSGGGQDQPIIFYQDSNMAGSVYLSSHQGGTQPPKYEYRQIDVI